VSFVIIFLLGQSYEIRMLDNRKLGELPELNGKLVKVKQVVDFRRGVCLVWFGFIFLFLFLYFS
jgi:hypothetical protein